MSTDPRLSELLVRWENLQQQGQSLSAEELCADCPELVAELKQQIQALQSVNHLLGAAQSQASPASAPSAQQERDTAYRPTVPGYEILGVLGHGGMGVVYKARQVRLNRIVALKMILAGAHAGPRELARFRTEAEAAARLQHAHIVQIHEVGEQNGSPYFSLEFMDGGSLAQKLNGAPQPPRQAVDLVETLARAIHTAHEQGIVHRDLKPANVLLTADGLPKIADFGLAKRLNPESGAPAQRDQTKSGDIMGTPSYMAPEQAAGKTKEIGPVTDVYALGAVLYEMLTGRPPFRAETPFDTMSQVVSEEPVPPTRLQPKVPRDVETICLKCLRKEPGKRYASALALADDLRRFLNHEPIQARPVGRVEKLWRWCQRNPYVAGLSAIVVCLLLSVLLIATIATVSIAAARERQARAETARANAEAATSKQLADFLLGVFQSPDPFVLEGLGLHAGNETSAARDLLDRAAERIEAEFQGPALTKASLLDCIGNIYQSLAFSDKAEPLLQRALEIRTRQLPEDHPDLATSLFHLGLLRHFLDANPKAEPYYRQALAIREKHFGAKHLLVADVKFHLAWLCNDLRHHAEAEALLRDVVEVRTRELGKKNRRVAMTRALLAIALMMQGKDAEALQVSLATLDAPDVAQALTLYLRAMGYRKQGKFDEAEKAYRQLHEMARRLLSDNHPVMAAILGDMAGLMQEHGQLEEAERLIRQAIAIGSRFGNDHPKLIEARVALAKGLSDKGNAALAKGLSGGDSFAEAEKQFQEALKSVRKRESMHHPQAKTIIEHLVRLYDAWGKPEKAAEYRALLREWPAP
jgi:serine/threonine protein kinase